MLADVIGDRAGGRVLDLGTGEGYMLEALRNAGCCAEGVGIDFSQALLAAAARRFDADPTVQLIEHDLAKPLPGGLGMFDIVISALAIHHLEDARKCDLYGEAFTLLKSGAQSESLFVSTYAASATDGAATSFTVATWATRPGGPSLTAIAPTLELGSSTGKRSR